MASTSIVIVTDNPSECPVCIVALHLK
jgi:hypothetical protein